MVPQTLLAAGRVAVTGRDIRAFRRGVSSRHDLPQRQVRVLTILNVPDRIATRSHRSLPHVARVRLHRLHGAQFRPIVLLPPRQPVCLGSGSGATRQPQRRPIRECPERVGRAGRRQLRQRPLVACNESHRTINFSENRSRGDIRRACVAGTRVAGCTATYISCTTLLHCTSCMTACSFRRNWLSTPRFACSPYSHSTAHQHASHILPHHCRTRVQSVRATAEVETSASLGSPAVRVACHCTGACWRAGVDIHACLTVLSRTGSQHDCAV